MFVVLCNLAFLNLTTACLLTMILVKPFKSKASLLVFTMSVWLVLLRCTISLLQNFEKIKDPYDWEVGKHGIQIKFSYEGMNYGATYLPGVAAEQEWDQLTTIENLIEKAGFSGTFDEVKETMLAERYQSCKATINYAEYLKFIEENKDLFKLTTKSIKEFLNENK